MSNTPINAQQHPPLPLGYTPEAAESTAGGKTAVAGDAGVPAPPAPKPRDLDGLPSPRPPSGADTTQTNARINALTANLHTDVTAMLSLMHEVSRETRKSAAEVRAAERETRFNLLQSGVDDLREAAKWALAAGVVAAAGKVVQGFASMGAGAIKTGAGGLAALGGGLSAAGGIKGQGMMSTNPTGAELVAQQWSGYGKVAEGAGNAASGAADGVSGSGGVVSGIADAVAAGFNYKSKQKEADQKAKEAEAERLQAGIERSSEFIQSMRDTLQDIQQRLAAMQQSEHDTAVAVVRV
ncbi:type III secretion system translocon subunit SctB [uncultured Thiohalocapsa sp.]|uniref:type III secretion system translocon subunit SctB n=1 Tax=uncultured Thiohalocapsa sp. TaxID=768990 RepID=UPI00260024E0|nr:type III secretion system translocon subunit SctB [uncultured Thiohalocapsa sp.]